MIQLRIAALVGIALVTASALIGTQPARAADDGAFRVTPASELFNVVLTAGTSEQRTITVENTAQTAQYLHFSVKPSAGAPTAHLRDRIVLDARVGTCGATDDQAPTLDQLRDPHPTARFAARETAVMCLTALLPIDAPTTRETATHVDLVFTAAPEGELAFTGTHPALVSVAVLAVAILTLGIVLWRSARKNGNPE